MAKALFTNNASSTLYSTLAQGATMLICAAGEGSKFPTPTGGDYFYLTIYEKDMSANEEQYEIVKVTARSSDTFTIERDVENVVGVSGGRAYPTVALRTVYLELRMTAAGASGMLQSGDIGSTVAGSPTLSVVTGTTQSAAANTHYVLTSASATTVTLPASPSAGDIIWVTVANTRVDNVIDPNGKSINGASWSMTLDNAYATVQLMYVDGTSMWRIL